MKAPNGYGSVVKQSGNRRRPYVVRKTTGYNDKGQPIYYAIGYYATRREAIDALAEYNRNPYDLNRSKYTVADVYNEWVETELPKLSQSNQVALRSAYKHCAPLYDVPFRSLKKYQMQNVIDACEKKSMQAHMRNLIIKLEDYAYEMDIINKKYADLLTISRGDPVRIRSCFTNEEIAFLWSEQNTSGVAEILFMLYTGMRIGEATTLPTANIHDNLIQYGIKTAAGKNRIIPIHSKIQQIVDDRMESLVLFNTDNLRNYRDRYANRFKELMTKYDMHHLPHDCRHTFRSELDRQGANKVCIDLLMGHSSGGTGERVYTHKTINELRDTIELVRFSP